MNFKIESTGQLNELRPKNEDPKNDITNSISSLCLKNKWLSSEEVCHLLMISKRTLMSYRSRGILPFAQIGRKIYYKASDIDDYLDQHYIKAHYQAERRSL